MNTTLFTGICTALVTPFQNGRVDEARMRQLVRRQADAGIPALAVCGTTGEAPTLSDEEKLRLFSVCRQEAEGRCQILAGTGSNDTAHAVRLSIRAQQAGADALLVVTPYYNRATPAGLLAHYRAISDAVRIPVIAYNVPGRTGVDIPVSLYPELAALDNLAGVKEASGDITKITKIRECCPPDFRIYTGNDTMIVPAVSCGARGAISVVSNLFPALAAAAARAADSGDRSAADLQVQITKLSQLLFREVNPIPVKAAMKLMGMDCGSCRLPLTDAHPETVRLLQAYLEAHSEE